MEVIRVREKPEWASRAIAYFQKIWGNEQRNPVYEDSIRHSLTTDAPLPRWYLLTEGNTIVGCAGLITNDFISRMDHIGFYERYGFEYVGTGYHPWGDQSRIYTRGTGK